MSTGMKTAMAGEKAYSERVGWMYRENWRKLGRVRQGEIARVEWQENERG